jgi:hypothetical protein
MDGGAIVDGRAIVDGERDATKQEISLPFPPDLFYAVIMQKLGAGTFFLPPTTTNRGLSNRVSIH